MKDAHDNPYNAQIRPFVMACADCGEVGPITALRYIEHDGRPLPIGDHALAPLCADDAAIERRVWGERRLPRYAQPPSEQSVLDDDGKRVHLTMCFRCNGTGLVSGGGCFECWGARWALLDPKGVRRTARWWQTFQQNRTP